jgi:hypothetical protein
MRALGERRPAGRRPRLWVVGWVGAGLFVVVVVVVGVAVVAAAEQDAVVGAGGAAVGPVGLVVDVAPGGGGVAVA